MSIIFRILGFVSCILSAYMYQSGCEYAIWLFALGVFFHEEANYAELKRRFWK